MYNLANLNDYEFEILCKDIMEKKLRITLHRFSKGRDGGIDLCDSNKTMKYMIQVKHYMNSRFTNLIFSLRNEIAKVEKQNPSVYYICCSIELTKQQRTEIISLFPKYMNDISYVMDKVEIDDFLSNDENREIVEKNYKLWLCSSNILSIIQNQNVFIDCNEIMYEIEKYTKLFVTTNAYYQCRNKLLEKNVLIITGSPGVGKSTISKMLLLFFASESFVVRYVSDNNIKDLKNVLSQDLSKKEIILLDDFLGQHYLDLSDKQPNELKSLISLVDRNPNKKMIMNSRITIINEAVHSSIVFSELISNHVKDNYIIDLDKMSALEKAAILYNHIYFNELPIEYFTALCIKNNYKEIIKHRNYNPRIIEHVTKPINYSEVPPQDYLKYVISKLDNPNCVWDDEFRNRLDDIDRVFMNTLYSLTNTRVEMRTLMNAFNFRSLKMNHQTTLNAFLEVLKRLTGSLVKIIVEKDVQYISVSNPSINDFLSENIKDNINEQIAIIKYAKYIEQILKFKKNKKEVTEIIMTNKIMELDSISKTISFHILDLIKFYQLMDENIKKIIYSAFESVCSKLYFGFEDLIVEFIVKGFVHFYCLEILIFDNLEYLSSHFSYDNLTILYDWHKKNYELSERDSSIYELGFIQAIQSRVLDLVNDDLQEIVYKVISRKDLHLDLPLDISLDDRKRIYIENYYEHVDQSLNSVINHHLQILLEKTTLTITDDKIDFDFIYYNLNIDDEIGYYVENEINELKAEYYMDDFKGTQTDNEWNTIESMFRK